MLGPGIGRRQQREDQIDRPVVERIERDRPFETCEHTIQSVQFGQLAVRNGQPPPETGAGETLALGEHIVDSPLGHAGRCRRAARDFQQHLLFVAGAQLRDHGAW